MQCPPCDIELAPVDVCSTEQKALDQVRSRTFYIKLPFAYMSGVAMPGWAMTPQPVAAEHPQASEQHADAEPLDYIQRYWKLARANEIIFLVLISEEIVEELKIASSAADLRACRPSLSTQKSS